MIRAILISFLIVCAIMGICEIIYIVKMFLCTPDIRVKNFAIVVLKHGNAVKQLNYLWQKFKWHGSDFTDGIIAVTDLIDDDELLECKSFVYDKSIVLCNLATVNVCEYIQEEL